MPIAADLVALGEVLAKAPKKKSRTTTTALGPKVTTINQQYSWHPLIGFVTNQLKPLAISDRSAILSGWLTWLTNRQSKFVNALNLAKVDPGVPAALKPRTLPTAPDDLMITHFTDPFRRLIVGRETKDHDEPDGTDQATAAIADAAAAASAAANAAATPQAAAALLQQIRNLADVYARWEAAATIAANLVTHQLARPALTAPELVARLLAFFRTEGDLTVPPEIDTLNTDLQRVPLPPGRSFFTPTVTPDYYTYCATYLVDQAKFIKKYGADISLPAVAADGSFAVTLAGMDILWNLQFQLEAEAVYPTAPPFTQTDYFDWWALNREHVLQLEHDKAVQAVVDELVLQRKMLSLTSFDAAAPAGPTYRVTATDIKSYAGSASGASVGYLVSMLTQAAWYLDRLTYGPTRFGPGAPTRVPEPMVYLLYHVGSEAPAMLCSAAQAAADRTASSPAAKALRDALRQNGYTPQVAAAAERVKSVRKSAAMARLNSPYSVKQKQRLADDWPVVAAVLRQPAVLQPLTDYITAADSTEWDDNFFAMRENILGYRRMWEFLKPQVAP